MIKPYLYLNLLKEMRKKGEKMQDICQLLDVSYFTLEKRLAGITQWTIGEIETLCNHYNKNYYELFEKE